ncbi:ABC transporter permease [Paenibacillus aceris]|uniref:Aldouronate transport system permease protein n=1 Tax=Paenibacillus aceris TaxID=869555 RepID=A0ABS4HX39_9BACL|nr:ABC transporter permease subunit [Paenibacillus aceris]MBP1963209.1 putative aldouronate transport system permease protein [Paenibacillus aceris]
MNTNAPPIHLINTEARKKRTRLYYSKYWQLYCMIMPGIMFFFLFKYVPILGSVIAFQDYNVYKGIMGSPFVGLKHFETLFTYPEFLKILKNTVFISIYQLVFGFPAPIILALLLNEVRKMWFKRSVQTIVYLPHFLSWVIVGGLVINVLSPNYGIINEILEFLGIERKFFMQQPEFFRSIVVASGIWKEVGWNTIIYLAALASINMEMYEAADVDGAGRFRKMISITLPSLLPTIMILFLLRIGHLLDLGFEQIYMLINPLVAEKGQIIDTYIYSVGLLGGQYSYTTAIGIFKSVVGLMLIFSFNQISKRLTGETLY